ncbi:MAG: FHA domain-containing protein [bacterium]
MSTIRSATGEVFTLSARTVVGRAAACGLRLDSPRVSGEHAVSMWTGTTWQVRDLGSRNGTVVDGRRLEPGEAVVAGVGSRVAFGDQVFEWLQVVAPVAVAVSEAGRRAVAAGGVLAIPDREDPEVIVFWRPGGWVMEDEAGLRPAGADLRIQGERWRLELPEAFEATVEGRQRPAGGRAGPARGQPRRGTSRPAGIWAGAQRGDRVASPPPAGHARSPAARRAGGWLGHLGRALSHAGPRSPRPERAGVPGPP